jgi:hypothetical protein
MLALLPLLCLTLVILMLHRRGALLRQAILDGAVAVGVALAAMTELASLVHGIGPWTVGIFWLLACAGAGLWWQRVRRVATVPPLPRPRGWDAVLLVPPVAVALVTLACALSSAPNNWDAMTYHLARVAHWIRNGSVEHFPTTILRQLHQSPWAEYALMHLQLLCGSDRCAAMLQWCAFVGCLSGVSLIALRLGGDRRAQLFTAAIAATIPMAVLQASSTQNDLVAAFWLVAFSDAALRLIRERPAPVGAWLPLGGALGLAMLTKGTTYVYALPMLVWLAVSLLRARAGWRAWKLMPVAVAIALAVNLGFWARNVGTYGSPLGPGHEGEHYYLSQTISPASVVSGAIRNAALHLGTFDTRRTTDAAIGLLKALGIDPNDRRTTWEGTDFRVPEVSTHEDWAGNLVHLCAYALALLAVVALAIRERARKQPGSVWAPTSLWALCIGAGFVLFGAAVKWQLWHSRLHVPLFVLFAPALALALAAIPRPRFLPALFSLALLALASPWLLTNTSRPLVAWPAFTRNPTLFSLSRDEQYFINRSELRDRYQRAAKCLREAKCTDVGLLLGEDDWEYPLWNFTGRDGNPVRFEHVEVDNLSVHTPGEVRDFKPCALVTVNRNPKRDCGLARKDSCSAADMSVYLRP